MLGQFFTKSKILQEKVYEFIFNKPNEILEPSCGRGDLVVYIQSKMPQIKFAVYEIDDKIHDFLIDKKQIIFGDFLVQQINKKYITIIGNPPYIRTKKGNLYIDFIKRCYELLDDNGELVFIIPSDFFKLTCASTLLTDMLNQGSFTHIYHPNDETLFENACIDVVVFRYYKNPKLNKIVTYNGKLMYINNNAGFITWSENPIDKSTKNIGDFFDVCVGFVTGKDDVFQHDTLGNIEVLWSKNQIKKFILIDKYPSGDKQIDDWLLKHKDKLLDRKIRKFDESNWFQWGGLRNMSIIEQNKGKPCIYLRNMSRKDEIAFVGKVDYFGPGLFMMLPKTTVDINKTVNHLNSPRFKQHFIYANRFKIGHMQLCKSYCA